MLKLSKIDHEDSEQATTRLPFPDRIENRGPMVSGRANSKLKLAAPGFGPAAEPPRISPAWRRHAARKRVNVKCGERRAASASGRGPWRRSLASEPLDRR